MASKRKILLKLDPYQAKRLISKKELYEIYLAEDTANHRFVALKRLRPDIENREEGRGYLLKEAYLTAQFSHPSIIPIFSIGNEAQETYYAMPFIEGHTLKDFLYQCLQLEEKGAAIPILLAP